MNVYRDPEEREFGIDWRNADEVSVGSRGWRDRIGGRLKHGVTLRLCNGNSEQGHRITVSRVRARQIAIAIAQASGMRWERHGPLCPLPLRLARILRSRRKDFDATPAVDDPVFIWSGEHNAYWRPEAAGYTVRCSAAGIYSRAEATRITSHCGPEKRIELEPVPASWRLLGDAA